MLKDSDRFRLLRGVCGCFAGTNVAARPRGTSSMKRVAILILMLAISGTAVGCGEDRAEISTTVAMEWSQDSIDTVSEVLVELLMVAPVLRDTLEKVPTAETLLTGFVADQIRDNIAWHYSVPVPGQQALYRMTATAAIEIEIDLPLLDTFPYAVTLPFHLMVDTDARTVQDWTADFDNAAAAAY